MPDAEGIVGTLGAGGEGREPVLLLDGVQAVPAPGEDLVRVGLMADVPHQAVFRGVENVVQCDGQLDRAQPGGEMPAPRRDGADQEVAQLCADERELPLGKGPKVSGALDAREQGVKRG